MEREWWPQVGAPVAGGDIPPVAHLDWYIPKLGEGYSHDLSQSGLMMDWDWAELLSGQVGQLDKWWSLGLADPSELVAELEGVSPNRVVCCAGATQAVQLALMAALESRGQDGDDGRDGRMTRVAVEMPSYSPVTQSARLLGLETIPFHRLPHHERASALPWHLDRVALSEILPTVGALIFTPVLNPCGWSLTDDDRVWLVDATSRHEVMLIADEVYDHALRPEGLYKPFFAEGEHCISVSSLTKCHAMGNLRFGWLIASKSVAQAAHRAFRTTAALLPSPVITMVAAAWPHLDTAMDRITMLRQANLPRLQEVLAKHEIDWAPPPAGLFGAFKLPGGASAFEVVETLGKKHDLLAVPGCMFDESLADWLRVAWSIDADKFVAAMAALDALLSDLK
jgi:aspartate/methionine/tyrosine aminotransferase